VYESTGEEWVNITKAVKNLQMKIRRRRTGLRTCCALRRNNFKRPK
jgi:hypothetical protein